MHRIMAVGLFMCLVGCGQEGELDKLFREKKYEEFVNEVKKLDPYRQNRGFDEQMAVATRESRRQKCERDKNVLAPKLRELDSQGAYSEMLSIAAKCKDTDSEITALVKKAEHELDPETIFKKMSAAAHLATAKRLMVEADRISEARRHLAAIKTEDKEHAESSLLARRLAEREKVSAAREKAIAHKKAVSDREASARDMEQLLLSKGMDVYVTVRGSDKATLHLKYVLFSRPLIYQVVNDTTFLSSLKARGFKKVIFSDGYRQTWTVDL